MGEIYEKIVKTLERSRKYFDGINGFFRSAEEEDLEGLSSLMPNWKAEGHMKEKIDSGPFDVISKCVQF